MADNDDIIFVEGDSYEKLTLSFPTGQNFSTYDVVFVDALDADENVLQTNAYPTGESTSDIDLVVPDPTSNVCYFKFDKANMSTGYVTWRLRPQVADSDFSDDVYNPVDKVTKLFMK